MDGIFTLESILLHFSGSLLALTPIATFLVIGHALRQVPRWRRFGTWLLVGSPLTLVLAMLHFATFNPEAAAGGIGIGGLTQRILLVELQAWVAAMGWLAFRRSAPRSDDALLFGWSHGPEQRAENRPRGMTSRRWRLAASRS